jgi:ABC-2 type transport system permease protein
MAFWTLLWANTLMQLRNRSSLFWHFAFPLIFIVLFGLIFGRGVGTLHIGLVAGNSEWAKHFQAAFAEMEGVKLTRGEQGVLLEELKDGEVHVVVAFTATEAGQPVAVELFYDPGEVLASSTARTMVKGILV